MFDFKLLLSPDQPKFHPCSQFWAQLNTSSGMANFNLALGGWIETDFELAQVF